MNISLNCLKYYVDIDVDANTYADKMTMAGSNVEAVMTPYADINGVVVGKILEINQHENADKLVVCKIDIGSEFIQVVTGAKNVNVGDFVPVALVGANLADGLKIKKGKLRGVESNGMLCSVEELGMDLNLFPEFDPDGISILTEEYPLGKDVREIFHMDDTIAQFEITSNRADCFSYIGMARETAATLGTSYRMPEMNYTEVDGDINELCSVEVKSPELCSRFISRILVDVKIEESPKWLRDTLRSNGIRPINNIVDITNFVMLEMGQPMHGYDLRTLKDGKLIVRNAVKDEKMMTLDGEERELDETMLVIADPEKVLGVAGVMGGESSKVTDDTTTILFEAAHFDSASVRKTSKKIGLRTDSSTKFEKGLDDRLPKLAMDRACHLAEKIGAGRVLKGEIDVDFVDYQPRELDVDTERINAILGTNIPDDEIMRILTSLELEKVSEKRVKIPSFRKDISIIADLAEEVARMYGYDKLPANIDLGTATVGVKTKEQRVEDIIHDVMLANAMNEAMTYSFESPKVFEKLLLEDDSKLRDAIVIGNPLGDDFSLMRTQTANAMLTSLSTNFNKRNEKAYLYEIAKVYLADEIPLKKLPEERKVLTMGMYGKTDFFVVKGILDSLFEALHINEEVDYEKASDVPYLHSGRTAKIYVGEKEIGHVGEVHPSVLENYDIGERAYIAVLQIKELVEKTSFDRRFKRVSKYPSTVRDLALVSKKEVTVGEIKKCIVANAGKLLKKVELFDVYTGSQIEEGYKSVAYSLTFGADDRTLTEEEVSKVVNKVLNKLENELNVSLRA